MNDNLNYLQIRTSFLSSILDWSKADLVGFTALMGNTSQFLHQALSEGDEQKAVFSSTRIPNTCCDLIIKSCSTYTVEENSKEETGASCPMMAERGFESYLGVPIFQDGVCIGALELMDCNRRVWKRREIGKLQEFSHVINALIRSS